MPTSRIELVQPVIDAVRECDRLYGVKTVLDVGCGAGFYGAALRQYMDFAYNRAFDGAKTADDLAQIKIEGIEPGLYKNPNWNHYDQIFKGTIQQAIDGMKKESSAFGIDNKADVILACDVLEHMELEEAERIAKELYARTEKYLIITTPSNFREQWQPDKPWEDEHQEHKCFIPPEMIDAWFPRVRIKKLGSVYMAVVTQEFLPV
jgi:predicted SAM-dependent methyltransferase